jgi:hypothetical protein
MEHGHHVMTQARLIVRCKCHLLHLVPEAPVELLSVDTPEHLLSGRQFSCSQNKHTDGSLPCCALCGTPNKGQSMRTTTSCCLAVTRPCT